MNPALSFERLLKHNPYCYISGFSLFVCLFFFPGVLQRDKGKSADLCINLLIEVELSAARLSISFDGH